MTVTLWDEIDESRRKKEVVEEDPRGLRWIRWALKKGTRVAEFREIEDRARQAIEEYVSTRGAKVDEGLEHRACSAVLAYLLTYSYDLQKCTEFHISQRLGIPRPRLNRLLSRMEWDGIIEGVGIGTSSPYRIVNLGRAMSDGYLDLEPGEAENLVKIVHEPWASIQLIRGGLVSSLPEAKLFTETIIGIQDIFSRSGREIELIHIPFSPGQVAQFYPGEDDFHTVLEFLRGLLHGRLSKDVLMELDVPNQVGPEDVREGLRRVAEKYLKLVRLRVRPLLDIFEEHGFNDGRMMIEKAYLKEKLLKQRTDSDGRQLPGWEIRRGDKTLEERAVIPGHGEVSLQTQELTPSHVRLLASVYRAACRFAEIAGGDTQLVETCRREVSRLESFVEPQPDGS
jgi:DNA-binding Lrp family transcriptional regulator